MSWIADVSFGHDAMTGALLAAHGVPGVIGYVSDHPEKNLTKANLADLLAHDLAVGLVFEDTVDDMHSNPPLGHGHGVTAFNEARAIGYDAQNCVIFAADDRNTGPDDWPAVLAYMDAFAQSVPVVGYYGDQDSIDWLYTRRPHWLYWQSDSTSFGTGISAHTDLIQRYNDPRVASLPLDASDILTHRVPFMGDDMYTQTDRDRDTRMAGQLDKISFTEGLELPAIAEMRGNVQNIAKGIVGFKPGVDPVTLAAALAPLLHTVDPHQLIDALSQVLSKVSLSVAS